MRWRGFLIGWIALGATAAIVSAACGDSNFAGDQNDASNADGSTDAEIVDAAGNSDALADGGVESGVCGSLHDPLMIPIPTSPSYCIDSTEVTRAQYQQFINAISFGYTPPADPRCNWNTIYDSNETCLTALGDAGNNFPITCINWCDAVSYCAWAGKRLCGRIGSSAHLTVTDAKDKSASQWENACTANGTREFPYGNAFVDGGCNLPQPPGTNALAAAGSPTYSACVGGYSVLHDMAGNAQEWIDACNDADASDVSISNCVIMGSSYEYAQLTPYGQCADYTTAGRNFIKEDVGFRCCSN